MSRTMSRAAFRALRVRVGRVESRLAEADRAARETIEAQVAGGLSRRLGHTAAMNPYTKGTAHRKAWSDGWNAEHQRLGGRRAA